ncbi:hypothetical protein ACFL0H_08870 [Thermodesulfobacteriota bacterium]
MGAMAGFGIFGVLVSIIFVVLLIVFLARISHWAYQTQKKLDVTNKLIEEIANRLSKGASPGK